MDQDRRMDEAQDSLYGLEHTLSWIMVLTAAILAVLGTLVGLGVIELREGVTNLTQTGAEEGGFLTSNFWDGTLLLFSAIAAGLLAYTLHSNDHHRMRDLSHVKQSDKSMWGVEHSLAYLLALGSIVYVVIGLLTGFNALSSTHDQGDGLIWVWFGVAGATLTAALHAVRHHQTDEDYIRDMIDERVGTRAPVTGATTRTGVQPR
jgi:hypothetical protein